MFIVYYFNEPIAACSTLEAAGKIKLKIADPGKVKIVFER